MQKPDCYACRYRAPVPGDAHSECRHPGATLIRGIGFLSKGLAEPEERSPDLTVKFQADGAPELEITFARRGILSGFTTWPLNYDPTWLRACSGFTVKENADAGA